MLQNPSKRLPQKKRKLKEFDQAQNLIEFPQIKPRTKHRNYGAIGRPIYHGPTRPPVEPTPLKGNTQYRSMGTLHQGLLVLGP